MASTLTADNGSTSGSSGLKWAGDASGVLALQTGAGTNALVLNSNASATFANNIFFSASGTGIVFNPVTSAPGDTSNTLNDYEIGTWTPTLTFASGGPATLSTAVGKYIKVGQQVTIWLYIVVSNLNSGSGVAFIGNLPFTSAPNSGTQGDSIEGSTFAPNYWANFTSTPIPGGYIQANNTRIYMINLVGTNNTSALAASYWTNTSAVYGNSTYFTTT
jgi:hypothetical protein